MPIEIKELHIRVTVNTSETGRNIASPQPPSNKNGGDSADKDALVAECVDQVLQILRKKQER